MKARWRIGPEVAGELGANTQMDVSVHPPRVSHLHYRFEGWLGDDLLESFPCYLVTERLADALRRSNLTGWSLLPVEITTSTEFDELYPGRALPGFSWLHVADGDGDFSLSAAHELLVSAQALQLLQQFNLAHADVEEVE